ncbi:MAG: dual specificity protein phosphatase family protein [Gemmataceae bacterium]|nr:dual specificity protein phosphatase family protein [Gemmataceae bacterium]
MSVPRRTILGLLLAGCVGTWLVLLVVAGSYEEGENYSLIEEGLYMGGNVKRPPPGTGAVLNLCRQEDPYQVAAHRWKPIVDAEPAPDMEWLAETVEFIDARWRAGVTTFVHCRNGVSRSGMVVTAYVIFKHGLGRDEALARVRAQRPITRPNPAFMERLAEWEQALKEQAAP